MKKILLIFILSLMTFTASFAQSVLADWEGVYEGEMIIGNTTRPNDSVKVTFELTPLEADSTWTYRMTYLSDKFGTIVKDYQLTRVGDSKVNFLLDEGDGIIIEMSLMNDCFYSMFEVMDNLYSTSLRKSGDSIHFDLFSSNMNEGTFTKNEAENPEEIFEVASYKPGLHQTAVFDKQKPPLSDKQKKARQEGLEAYEKLVDAADEAYAKRNYKRALKLYTRAATLKPSNEYAHRQKQKTEKRLSK